ncbi:hypothetical protein SK128_007198 [Halocaridina rubra]|uniref:Uncharacterized protein n=1 Tax=Halocaridina rubra TaxID=373956 RepID=A0AAN8WM34_HALRR
MRSPAETEAELNENEEKEETAVEELQIPTLEVGDADDEVDQSELKRYDPPQIPTYVAPSTPLHGQQSYSPNLDIDVSAPGGGHSKLTSSLQDSTKIRGANLLPITPRDVDISSLGTMPSGTLEDSGLPDVESPVGAQKITQNPCKVITLATPPPAVYLTPDEYDRALSAKVKEVVEDALLPDAKILYTASSSPRPSKKQNGSTKDKKTEEFMMPGLPMRPMTATRPIHLYAPSSSVSPSQLVDILQKLEDIENRLQDAVGTSALD